MNTTLIKQIAAMCGKVENLQRKAGAFRDDSDDDRRVCEALAKAKDSLLEALRYS